MSLIEFCKEIGDLATSDEGRLAVTDSKQGVNNISKLISILNDHLLPEMSADNEIEHTLLIKCVRAIGNLCIDNVLNRKLISEAGGMDAMIKICDKYAAHNDVSKMVVGALSNLSSGEPSEEQYITEEWIQPIFNVIQSCISDSKVPDDEIRILLALQALSHICDEIKVSSYIFKEPTLIESLLRVGDVLIMHASDDNELEECVGLLISCFASMLSGKDEKALESASDWNGFIPLLINSLIYKTDDDLQKNSISLLLALFTANPTIQLDKVLIEILLSIVASYTERLDEYQTQMLRILNILSSNDDNLPLFLECFEDIQPFVSSCSVTVRSTGFELFAKLCYDDKARHQLVKHGVIDTILKQVKLSKDLSPQLLCAVLGGLRNISLSKDIAITLVDSNIITDLLVILRINVNENASILKAQYHTLKLLRTMLLACDHKDYESLVSSFMTEHDSDDRFLFETISDMILSDAEHIRYEAGRIIAELCGGNNTTNVETKEEDIKEKKNNNDDVCNMMICSLFNQANMSWKHFTGIIPILCNISTSEHDILQNEGSNAIWHLCNNHTVPLCVLLQNESVIGTNIASIQSQSEGKEHKYQHDKFNCVTIEACFKYWLNSGNQALQVKAIGCMYRLIIKDMLTSFQVESDNAEDCIPELFSSETVEEFQVAIEEWVSKDGDKYIENIDLINIIKTIDTTLSNKSTVNDACQPLLSMFENFM